MSILNDIANVLQVWSEPVPPAFEPVFFDVSVGSVLFEREGQTVTVSVAVDNIAAAQATGAAPWSQQGFLEADGPNGSFFMIYEDDWTLNPGGLAAPASWVTAYTTDAPPPPDPGPGSQVPVYIGYAPSGAQLPYLVMRPLIIDTVTDLALMGAAIDWDSQFSVYCCAASVEASFNLALAVIGTTQGARVQGTTLSASMGYNGAEVEGHYESQVTVQLNQGALV